MLKSTVGSTVHILKSKELLHGRVLRKAHSPSLRRRKRRMTRRIRMGGENTAPHRRGVRGMEKARGCLMASQHPLVGRWRTPCSLVPTPLLISVCAKNISLTASGEKVILWTREADRVILTTCQQQGANQSTFQAISTQLGDKTLNEVSRRFRDLLRLFRTTACKVNLEDETMTTEQHTVTDKEHTEPTQKGQNQVQTLQRRGAERIFVTAVYSYHI